MRTSNKLFRLWSLAAIVAMLAAMVPVGGPAVAKPVSAQPTDLFFSEYIEGSSNNKALEIFNGTGAPIDLEAGSYNVQIFFNGSTNAGLTINLEGIVANGDVFVLANGGAIADILAQADQTNGAGWFNGDDAVVLNKGSDVLDAIGQVGLDPGSEWGAGDQSTQNNTLQRQATLCQGDMDASDPFDPAAEWNGFAQDTFEGLGADAADCGTDEPEQTPVINEFVFNHTGSDSEAFIEVFGEPSTDYSGFTVLEIEGDSSGAGTIDAVLDLSSTDGDGFWLNDEDAENGTVSLLLVEGFSGSIGDDLDVDNDGLLDTSPWTRIVDSIAVSDGGSSDQTYADVTLIPGYDGISFSVGGASRIPNGTDSDSAGDWVRNDFDGFGFPGFTGSQAIGEAVNTPGAANEVITVIVDQFGVCGDPATPIHDIQGDGLVSPDVGNVRAVEAVVVGTFQGDDEIGGYFLQEEDSDIDDDSMTSEGLRVFDNANNPQEGELVRIRGSVTEFFDLTELTNVTDFLDCGEGVASEAVVNLPVATIDDLEAYEGMLVRFPQELTISEFFNFDRFGEIVLTTERQYQPTAIEEPGSSEAAALADLNARSRITLDDGRSNQNPDPAIHPNGDVFDLTNLFRGGDTVTNLTGVMDYSFGNYKIQPTAAADYTPVNTRPEAPEEVGGDLQIAAFNVLNYFTTLDDSGPICGPLADQGCRGADNSDELARQRAKIVAALAELEADVVGLIEIENHPADIPTADLVSGVNDLLGPGTYDYISTGAIGPDAIRQAFIYKPATVTPVGSYAALDTGEFLDPNNLGGAKNRPAVTQTFMSNETGGMVTVSVNHLKSKGSPCGPGDDDPQTGSCNLTRTLAAEELADWLATGPTGYPEAPVMIIGDLNSYDKEVPIDVFRVAGYDDLLLTYQGELAYSYVFDGQLGYLDYAMASSNLLQSITGAAAWHINADEPDILDYDTSFKQDAQDALYEPNEYRSSDHDPVVVGLSPLPQCNSLNATIYVNPDGVIVGGPWDGRDYSHVIFGTSGDDVIVGTNLSDVIHGKGGNDVICGLEGDDVIQARRGNDYLDAGAGNDVVIGHFGDDVLIGDLGNDTLVGMQGDDELYGGPGRDLLNGHRGTDVCNGGDDGDRDRAVQCEEEIDIP